MQTAAALKLIKNSLRKRQKENRKFSMRELARRIRVSSGYLSRVLSGQKNLTEEIALKLSDVLQMDSLQKTAVAEVFQRQLNKETPNSSLDILNEYELLSQEADWILSKWYYLAILDMLIFSNIKEFPEEIARRLRISPEESRAALKSLEKMGFTVRDEKGQLRKKHLHIRFPTKFSREVIRNFHEAQMKRAIWVLQNNKTQADFDQRLITGITIAADPIKFKEAEAILHKAIYEAAQVLSSGDSSDIYQLNVQLFPQTKC